MQGQPHPPPVITQAQNKKRSTTGIVWIWASIQPTSVSRCCLVGPRQHQTRYTIRQQAHNSLTTCIALTRASATTPKSKRRASCCHSSSRVGTYFKRHNKQKTLVDGCALIKVTTPRVVSHQWHVLLRLSQGQDWYKGPKLYCLSLLIGCQ